MEEIIIQFAGETNLILNGEVLEANPIGRHPSWEFRLLDVDNNEITIPMSSNEIQDTTVTLNIAGDIKTPTFWSIELVNQEGDIFRITIFPNNGKLLTRNL